MLVRGKDKIAEVIVIGIVTASAESMRYERDVGREYAVLDRAQGQTSHEHCCLRNN